MIHNLWNLKLSDLISFDQSLSLEYHYLKNIHISRLINYIRFCLAVVA
jgi:hypothetical protein